MKHLILAQFVSLSVGFAPPLIADEGPIFDEPTKPKIKPADDCRRLFDQARNAAQLGLFADAQRDNDRAMALAEEGACPLFYETLYNKACYFAQDGKIDAAFDAIERLTKIMRADAPKPAVWTRFKKLLESDKDLGKIRKDPRFAKVLAGFKP